MTTEDIEEDIFDGEDELNEVTYAKYQHIFVLFRWISVRQRMLQKKD